MDKIWYYLNHITKEKAGPYTDEELIKLLNQGVVDVDDYIWMKDFENWLKVEDSIYSIYIGE
ncbi:hypothetical protein HMPREF9013_1167 [Bulleidia extructa W1219]|jgi:hypothetical protein|uniref:GYF domain-containing protein n=1 Tax=Bulleidia extructa W1219 TaxID=679192 RepID=D2MPP2_9FIRM|nr:DUF4339 domain-containing protein [Bulleidia extructa]EFC05462.1 hypothetical protein HMPREF9013_1167 [Bulleidia extructa W1219]